MDDFFIIQLNIADKVHRLKCKRSEEVHARRAARLVNEKILSYGGYFNNSEIELKDLLTMVAFHFSVEKLRLEEENDASPVYDKIKDLSLTIEKYLSLGM